MTTRLRVRRARALFLWRSLLPGGVERTAITLVDHLQANPDIEYNLRGYRLLGDAGTHREIDDPRQVDFGPESGHIFCGTVRYDSAVARVVSCGWTG